MSYRLCLFAANGSVAFIKPPMKPESLYLLFAKVSCELLHPNNSMMSARQMTEVATTAASKSISPAVSLICYSYGVSVDKCEQPVLTCC